MKKTLQSSAACLAVLALVSLASCLSIPPASVAPTANAETKPAVQPTTSTAPKATLTPAQGIEAAMDRSAAASQFSGTVLVAQGGKILFRKAYGYRDYAAGDAMEPTDIFQIGSITKSFTALGILMLAEQGKLSLDDRIDAYVAGLPNPTVTLRQLLSHSSGYNDYLSLIDFKQANTQEIVLDAIRKDVPDPAGKRFRYSNSGYYLLGLVIEKASGRSYAEFIKTQIADPLGMRDTLVAFHPPQAERLALPHGPGYQGLESLEDAITWSAGGITSTVDDLLAYDRGLRGSQLLSPESTALLYHAASPGKEYGFGWGRTKRSWGGVSYSIALHGGATRGFCAMLYRNLDLDSTIVILENQEFSRDLNLLARELEDQLDYAR